MRDEGKNLPSPPEGRRTVLQMFQRPRTEPNYKILCRCRRLKLKTHVIWVGFRISIISKLVMKESCQQENFYEWKLKRSDVAHDELGFAFLVSLPRENSFRASAFSLLLHAACAAWIDYATLNLGFSNDNYFTYKSLR
jgi:hypothetical protein